MAAGNICPARREIIWDRLMSPADPSNASRPTRWGLAAKLFAILTLLGAIAVLVTGVLGYMRARNALQESIYNQLTATRKARRARSKPTSGLSATN
jgi:hypothetical protein